MTAARVFDDLITIGRVVRPQGRKGEVVVEPFSDRPGRFSELRRIFLPGEGEGVAERQVDRHWPHKGREVLKLAGIDSIEDAERLRGMDVRIPQEDLDVLPQGSYYHYELRGLRVEDESGAELGAVADILKTGAGADVLVVKGPAGESLVPLVSSFIKEVDLLGGRVVAVPPELVDAAD
jgi:16S rRNA processing protein RimM